MKKCKKIIILIFIITIICILIIMCRKVKNEFYTVDINIEKNSDNYAKVSSFEEFQEALKSNKIQIIELQNDLDLGYYNIQKQIKIPNITNHNEPLSHPKLLETGISKIKIQNKDGLIICSKNGYRISHANLIIDNARNIKIENIKFEELWEWDEKTQGEYDRNDWDYITIKNSENICIKNCEFSKSYDGIVDINNSNNITIEYCKLNSIDLDNEYYNIQFEYLEKNIENFPMYKFLRKEGQLSIEEIKNLVSFQYKVYTIGTKEKKDKQNNNIVIHDNIYLNAKTRIPRTRNSRVYLYNIYVDSTNIINLQKDIKDKFLKIQSQYSKMVSLDTYGVIATENSYILVENCIFNKIASPYNIYSKNETLGFITILPRQMSANFLKNKLENTVGNKNEK